MLMYNDFNAGISLEHREIMKLKEKLNSLAKYVHSFEINWFRL